MPTVLIYTKVQRINQVFNDFPKGKGPMTGIFYTTGSIASFTIPVVTGYMADSGINSIMGLDAAIALAGFIVACIIYVRYNSVMKNRKAA